MRQKIMKLIMPSSLLEYLFHLLHHFDGIMGANLMRCGTPSRHLEYVFTGVTRPFTPLGTRENLMWHNMLSARPFI